MNQCLADFSDHVKLQDLAPSTVENYLCALRRFANHFGADPRTLGDAEVRSYLLHLREVRKLSPTTLKITRVALNRFFHLFLGIDPPFPVFSEFRVREHKTLPAVLTRGEVRGLLGAVESIRWRSVLTLIYGCGLRSSEACKLEVTDIDSAGGHILVRDAKGNKSRRVPVAAGVVDVVRDFYRLHRHPRYVFPKLPPDWRLGLDNTERRIFAHKCRALGNATEPVLTRSVSGVWKAVVQARRLNRKGITVHTLRHSYATHMLEDGVNLRYLSAYLGHASLEQTAQYIHLTACSEARTREVIDQLFATVVAGRNPGRSSPATNPSARG